MNCLPLKIIVMNCIIKKKKLLVVALKQELMKIYSKKIERIHLFYFQKKFKYFLKHDLE